MTLTWSDFAARFWSWSGARQRYEIWIFTILTIVLIGVLDRATTRDVSLAVFYVVPVAVGAWLLGLGSGFALALLSIAVWLSADDAFAMHTPDIQLWNALVRLTFYTIVILLIDRINSLQQDLHHRVQLRAAELTREIAERRKAEHELLRISEREQRRIGQDLHDGLCQQLTGTALAGHVLTQKLATAERPEVEDARRIVDFVEDSIRLARGIAKGLHPVELEADGLMQALDGFAAQTSELFGVDCRFECDSPVLMHDRSTAVHLFRIAQEAVGNAAKHGHAEHIRILLDPTDNGTELRITDDGSGIPDPLPASAGMGLQIMADRAKVIGARFAVGRGAEGGTEVTCVLPRENESTSESDV
jgi:signal transduction histidine kinase